MLSGSAILRVGILLVAAALLAGVVQMLRPRERDRIEEPVSKPVPETGRAGTQLAVPPTVTRPSVPTAPIPAPQAAPPQAAAPVRAPDSLRAPDPVAPATANRPPLEFVPPATSMTVDEAIDNAAETAGPRAVALVDLNTGSVADLNGLKGGGMIGRAIVQRRPYASVGDLLAKRVLSRGVYQRIKDQVTVR